MPERQRARYDAFPLGMVDNIPAEEIPDEAVVKAQNMVLDRQSNLLGREGTTRHGSFNFLQYHSNLNRSAFEQTAGDSRRFARTGADVFTSSGSPAPLDNAEGDGFTIRFLANPHDTDMGTEDYATDHFVFGLLTKTTGDAGFAVYRTVDQAGLADDIAGAWKLSVIDSAGEVSRVTCPQVGLPYMSTATGSGVSDIWICYSETSETVTWYIDGVCMGTQQINPVDFSDDVGDIFEFTVGGSGAAFYDGELAEIYVWDSYYDRDQVIANTGTIGATPKSQAVLEILYDEGTGSPAAGGTVTWAHSTTGTSPAWATAGYVLDYAPRNFYDGYRTITPNYGTTHLGEATTTVGVERDPISLATRPAGYNVYSPNLASTPSDRITCSIYAKRGDSASDTWFQQVGGKDDIWKSRLSEFGVRVENNYDADSPVEDFYKIAFDWHREATDPVIICSPEYTDARPAGITGFTPIEFEYEWRHNLTGWATSRQIIIPANASRDCTTNGWFFSTWLRTDTFSSADSAIFTDDNGSIRIYLNGTAGVTEMKSLRVELGGSTPSELKIWLEPNKKYHLGVHARLDGIDVYLNGAKIRTYDADLVTLGYMAAYDGTIDWYYGYDPYIFADVVEHTQWNMSMWAMPADTTDFLTDFQASWWYPYPVLTTLDATLVARFNADYSGTTTATDLSGIADGTWLVSPPTFNTTNFEYIGFGDENWNVHEKHTLFDKSEVTLSALCESVPELGTPTTLSEFRYMIPDTHDWADGAAASVATEPWFVTHTETHVQPTTVDALVPYRMEPFVDPRGYFFGTVGTYGVDISRFWTSESVTNSDYEGTDGYHVGTGGVTYVELATINDSDQDEDRVDTMNQTVYEADLDHRPFVDFFWRIDDIEAGGAGRVVIMLESDITGTEAGAAISPHVHAELYVDGLTVDTAEYTFNVADPSEERFLILEYNEKEFPQSSLQVRIWGHCRNFDEEPDYADLNKITLYGIHWEPKWSPQMVWISDLKSYTGTLGTEREIFDYGIRNVNDDWVQVWITFKVEEPYCHIRSVYTDSFKEIWMHKPSSNYYLTEPPNLPTSYNFGVKNDATHYGSGAWLDFVTAVTSSSVAEFAYLEVYPGHFVGDRYDPMTTSEVPSFPEEAMSEVTSLFEHEDYTGTRKIWATAKHLAAPQNFLVSNTYATGHSFYQFDGEQWRYQEQQDLQGKNKGLTNWDENFGISWVQYDGSAYCGVPGYRYLIFIDNVNSAPTDVKITNGLPTGIAEWQATTAYTIGDEVIATDVDSNPYVFRAVTATGTSHSSEPSWGTIGVGETIADATVTWIKIDPDSKSMIALTEWNNRVWGIEYDTTNGRATAKLICSKLGDPTNWFDDAPNSGPATFEVGGAEAKNLTGLAVYEQSLFVFKTDRIYRMIPGQPNTALTQMSLQPWSNGLGCVASKSIQTIAGDLLFLSEEGISSLRSISDAGNIEQATVSRNIRDFINTNLLTAGRAASAVDRTHSRYLLSLPLEGSSGNSITYVYDYSNPQSPGFTYWSGKVVGNDMLNVLDTNSGTNYMLYAQAVTEAGLAYPLAQGKVPEQFHDDGKPIHYQIVTKAYTMGDEVLKKRFHRWFAKVQLQSDTVELYGKYKYDQDPGKTHSYSMTLSQAAESGSRYEPIAAQNTTYGTARFAATSTENQTIRYRMHGTPGRYGQSCQWELTCNTIDQAFGLQVFGFYWTVATDRYTENN